MSLRNSIEELQALNSAKVRKDILVFSSLQDFQILSVKNTDNNTFNVTYSVEQGITEGESKKNVHSSYFINVYVDTFRNTVIINNPTITSIPAKSSYQTKMLESYSTVDLVTTNEINDFLTILYSSSRIYKKE